MEPKEINEAGFFWVGRYEHVLKLWGKFLGQLNNSQLVCEILFSGRI
jgi:hypothetical protein